MRKILSSIRRSNTHDLQYRPEKNGYPFVGVGEKLIYTHSKDSG